MKMRTRECRPLPAYLVVDDSPTIRLAVAAALKSIHEGQPLTISQAESEKQAVEAFLNGSFDVVFLDMMLGGAKPALDVLRAILAAKPEAKVVLTTGLEREHPDVVESISIGAFAYLRKPVRAADVRGVLDEISAETGRTQRIK